MECIAYYDGRIGSPDELTIPFNDRSHFFGDGVYDAAMAAGGKVFAIGDHLDRFYSSAAAFDIKIPMDKPELAALLHELLAQIDIPESGDTFPHVPTYFVYWQVTRGVSPRSHSYDPDIEGKLWVMIRPEAMEDPAVPLKLIALEDHRFEYGNAKTLNLMPAVKYAQATRMAQADESVLHRGGIVTECAHSNISILRDGVFYSHPNDEHILRGIAKTHLISACYRESIPVIERAFTLDELENADEVIVTSSSALCASACQLDGRDIGGRDPETLDRLRRSVYGEFFTEVGCGSW